MLVPKMDDQKKAHHIEIVASSLDIDSILASFPDDTVLDESVRSASVLIVPTDLDSEYEGPAFPLRTREIYRYLRAGLAEKGTVEVAVRDEDFREFEYRSDTLIFPIIFVSSHILLPLVVDLLGTYIYDKLKSRIGSDASGRVKSEIHFTDPSGTQVSFKYDGSASTYEKVTAGHLRELGVWLKGDELPDDEE